MIFLFSLTLVVGEYVAMCVFVKFAASFHVQLVQVFWNRHGARTTKRIDVGIDKVRLTFLSIDMPQYHCLQVVEILEISRTWNGA